MKYNQGLKYLILFVGYFLIGIYIFSNEGKQYNFSVLFLSYLISAFSFYKMTQLNGRPYSLNKMFFIFMLFFIGIAPAAQFKHKVTFWGAGPFDVEQYFFLNLIFIFIILFYSLFYSMFSKKHHKTWLYSKFEKINLRQPNRKNKLRLKLLILSIISFIVYFYSVNFNFLALLIRGGIENSNSIEIAGPLALIIRIFLRPIPVIALISYRILNKKFDFFEFLLIILSLISNAPTGMPRFQAAALYIPVLLLYFKPFQRDINFSLSISLGLLVLFPILGSFRRFTSLDNIRFNSNNIFLQPSFDSYNNFLLLLDEKLMSYGKQLLGVILFFLPRSIWPNKPIGSGAKLAEETNLFFSNISMNFFGEGYYNFSYIGVLIFTLIIAYINATLDNSYWKSQNNQFLKILFLFILGMEFFILRGDLMSSFAYTIGIILSIVFVFRVITDKNTFFK